MRFSPDKLIAAMALAVLACAAQAAMVYSLAGHGDTLIRFDSATPGTVTTLGAISGAIGRLDGLDFRASDGLLYGYEANGSGIYGVDPLTGVTTLLGTSSAPVGNARLGMDFNPVADRLRVVNPNSDNRRINVDTGVAFLDGALAYAAGDVNFNRIPQIYDAAYTNADTNAATGTQLYYIDANRDTLVTTTNPNDGVLNTVGALGFNTSAFLGFDIFTDLAGVNTAYATLRVGGVDGLYSLNLVTGAATLIGVVAAEQLYGLAFAPAALVAPAVLAANAIAEPGTLALLAVSGMAALGWRRRKAGPAATTGCRSVTPAVR